MSSPSAAAAAASPPAAASPGPAAAPPAPTAPAASAPTTQKFAGRVYISPHNPEQNIPWAKGEYERADRATRLVFWTDGSVKQTKLHSDKIEGGVGGTNASSAVVWRQDLDDNTWEWADEAVVHDGITTIRHAEMHALVMALHRAEAILQSPAGAGKTSVGIYTDNLLCAECVRVYRRDKQRHDRWNGWGRALLRKIMQSTKRIREVGAQVDLTWIPGHNGVMGNNLADYIAKRASGTLWPAPSRSEFNRMRRRAKADNAREEDVRIFRQTKETMKARMVFNSRDQARALRLLGKCLELLHPALTKAMITTLRQFNNYLNPQSAITTLIIIIITAASHPFFSQFL